MAAEQSVLLSEGLEKCFEDFIQIYNLLRQEESSTSQEEIESTVNTLECAIQMMAQMIPFVNHTRHIMTEIVQNLIWFFKTFTSDVKNYTKSVQEVGKAAPI